MGATLLADVQNQIQKYWSGLFMDELRANLLLGQFVNKEYSGEIKKEGDQVTVSQINALTGENRTVGVDADVFGTEKVTTQYVEVKADKRAVAAIEIADLVELQSMIDQNNPKLRASMMYAIESQINTYLYSLVSPSTSSPDHDLGSTSSIDSDKLVDIRQLAAEAKWLFDGKWVGLMSPGHFTTLLKDDTLRSSDFVNDMPTVQGQKARRLFGFNIYEDNSRTGTTSLFFHPDFMHLVMQQGPRWKLSDLHGNKQFGYLLSVDLVYGAKLGIDGAKKHIKVYN